MKIKNYRLQTWGIVLLTIFVILSFFVANKTFILADLQTTINIQRVIPNLLITPLSFFSIIGSVEIASIILLVTLFLLPKLNKISALFMYGFFSFVEVIGKSIITQTAPPIEFLKTDLHFFLPVSAAVPKEFFSYPSGHSARTAFISGVLLFAIWKSHMRKEFKIAFALLILTFDLIMFISRVYLGEHWVTDVVGGMLLGYSFVFLYPLLASRFKKISV